MKTCPIRKFVLLRLGNVVLPSRILSLFEEAGQIVLYAPDGTVISLFFKLEFPYCKGEAEYEALII